MIEKLEKIADELERTNEKDGHKRKNNHFKN